MYPEIYTQGTKEGQQASEYFKKWRWYATFVSLTNTNEDGIGDILKVKEVMGLGVHEIHAFLAHRIDNQNLKDSIRKKQMQR